MADDDFLEWTAKQSDWTRDALRRHAIQPRLELTINDKKEILNSIRHSCGFGELSAPLNAFLKSDHLAEKSVSEGRAVLCSLGPVKHLNRLAKGQKLNFATDGITIIYGDNGSGKSGFCRVAKKLCRSLSSEVLLGNVFEAGPHLPVEVSVRYLVDGMSAPEEETWINGTPTPRAISQISVFDSQNARLYIDQQNRIAFLPLQIALLEAHGSHRVELDRTFSEEIKEIDRRLKVSLPGGYSVNGEIAKFLQTLDPKSKGTVPDAAKLAALATLSVEEVDELAALQLALANDPSTMAARRRRAIAALTEYLSTVEVVDSGLSTTSANSLRDLREQAIISLQAAQLAANEKFLDLPLGGVGMSPWRLMYDFAKTYAASLGLNTDSGLPSATGDRCVLCQVELSPSACARIEGFNAFVSGVANKAADDAVRARDEALLKWKEIAIPSHETVLAMLGEYGTLSPERQKTVSSISLYFDAARKRRQSLLAATDAASFSAALELPSSIADLISSEIQNLEKEALLDEKAASDDRTRAATRARREYLSDRRKLGQDLPTLVARCVDLETKSKLQKCREAVETGSISRKITALRRSLVMDEFEGRVRAEIRELGLTHIPLTVNDSSANGGSYFEVGVESLSAVPNRNVLSEGEQRALALACFLAELGGDVSGHGMIFDDPVSSLDHVRIRRAATRIVNEATKGRQVIIFTHNLLFFNEVIDAAARGTPPIPVLESFIAQSEQHGFGIVSSDETWIARPVNKRVESLRGRLREFASVTDFTTDEWRRWAKDFYTDLRETWERFVEEVLLCKVVERFNSDVKTQSLKGVVMEDNDYKIIYWAMKLVSERSGHDMAPAKAIPVPTPDEMKVDLDQFDAYRQIIAKRKRMAEDRRKELESPPKATIL